MNNSRLSLIRSVTKTIVLIVIILTSIGCATTKGSYSASNTINSYSPMATLNELSVEVKCHDDIPLSDGDKQRILNYIINNIKKDYTDRFHNINQNPCGPSTLHADVIVKTYDEGNAFARFMLAGLGAMHIDADVILINNETKKILAQYEVTKTFAWGGIYGSSTHIKDIEDGFSKAVAEAISKRQE